MYEYGNEEFVKKYHDKILSFIQEVREGSLFERIRSPHRTEIKYVLTWGQLVRHHKVKLGKI